MSIAHHLIWTAYGWWIPNDPRGGASRAIGCDVIEELRELHHGRRHLEPASASLRASPARAPESPAHPLVEFTAAEAKILGEAMAEDAARLHYTCYACAILSDHVQILIRQHRDAPEKMIHNLQEACMWVLRQEKKIRPADQPLWSGSGWTVSLDAPTEVWAAIDYINGISGKLGLPSQKWAFVKPYDNWPLQAEYTARSQFEVQEHSESPRRRRKPKSP